MGTEKIEESRSAENPPSPRNLVENLSDHVRKGLLNDGTPRDLQQSYFKVIK